MGYGVDGIWGRMKRFWSVTLPKEILCSSPVLFIHYLKALRYLNSIQELYAKV